MIQTEKSLNNCTEGNEIGKLLSYEFILTIVPEVDVSCSAVSWLSCWGSCLVVRACTIHSSPKLQRSIESVLVLFRHFFLFLASYSVHSSHFDRLFRNVLELHSRWTKASVFTPLGKLCSPLTLSISLTDNCPRTIQTDGSLGEIWTRR